MDNLSETLTRARGGDRTSIDSIIFEFGWVVDAECYTYLSSFRSDVSVSDLKQEVWMKVWGNIGKFQSYDEQNSERHFVAWLRTVAKRVILSLNRKARNKKRLPPQGVASFEDAAHEVPTCDHIGSPSSIVAGIEEANRLQKAVESLSSDELRSVIRSCFMEGLSLGQAAERMNLTYDQVRYRFHTALQELERILNQR